NRRARASWPRRSSSRPLLPTLGATPSHPRSRPRPALPRPGVQLAVGLLLLHRAAFEAELHQELERLSDLPPGLQPEVLHHLVAVERRAERLEVLLLGEARDPFFQLVLERAKARRSLRV